jgi:hypothetical protein
MGANAVTTVPVYVAGEVLTAADLNITNSGIPVFAGTTERDAAFGGTGEKTLAEGQFAYIEATNTTQYYDGAAWLALGGKVAQVQTATTAASFTSTTASFIDVTGLSVSITPSAATSTVLLFATVAGSVAGAGGDGMFRLVRGATAIAVGTSGSSVNGFALVSQAYPNAIFSNAVTFLDSPATTSATTYKVQVYAITSTTYVNRRGADALFGGFSSITAVEILA